MEKGIWKVWGEERGKQDIGGYIYFMEQSLS